MLASELFLGAGPPPGANRTTPQVFNIVGRNFSSDNQRRANTCILSLTQMVIHSSPLILNKTLPAVTVKNLCPKYRATVRTFQNACDMLWTCGKNVSDKMSESVAKI